MTQTKLMPASDTGSIEETVHSSTEEKIMVQVFPPREGTPLYDGTETSNGLITGIMEMTRAELNDEFLNSGDDIPLEKRDLNDMNNEVTGEFCAFRFYLDTIAPGFHADSLIFLLEEFKATYAGNILRITTSPGERLLPGELRKIRHYLENKWTGDFKVALGEDSALPPGTISALITSFYTEDFSYWEWTRACENGCLEDVMEAEQLLKYHIHEELDESQWDIDYDFNINDVFKDISYNMNRSWRKTEEVLDFLVGIGTRINSRDLVGNYFGRKGRLEMEFNLELLKWGIRKGIDINQVILSRTSIDWLYKAMDKARFEDKPYILEAIDFLRTKGGLTCEEIRNMENAIQPSYDDEVRKIRRINGLK